MFAYSELLRQKHDDKSKMNKLKKNLIYDFYNIKKIMLWFTF